MRGKARFLLGVSVVLFPLKGEKLKELVLEKPSMLSRYTVIPDAYERN